MTDVGGDERSPTEARGVLPTTLLGAALGGATAWVYHLTLLLGELHWGVSASRLALDDAVAWTVLAFAATLLAASRRRLSRAAVAVAILSVPVASLIAVCAGYGTACLVSRHDHERAYVETFRFAVSLLEHPLNLSAFWLRANGFLISVLVWQVALSGRTRYVPIVALGGVLAWWIQHVFHQGVHANAILWFVPVGALVCLAIQLALHLSATRERTADR